MDYRDFEFIETNSGYIDLYSLEVGDFFMEDTYPEVYQVTAIVKKDIGNGYPETVIESTNITDNCSIDWYHNTAFSAYAPCLISLKKAE